MSSSIKRILPRHFKILDLKVAGFKNTEIAKSLGMSPATVGAISRSPLFNAELQRRLKDRNEDGAAEEQEAFESKARSILTQNAEKASMVQSDLLDSEDDSVRLRASNSILDRVLGRADAKDGPSVANINITTEDANLIVLALQESENGSVENGSAHPSSRRQYPSENGQSDVHQEAFERPGERHREAEAQHRNGQKVVVIEEGEGTVSPKNLPSLLDLFAKHQNGVKSTPPTERSLENGKHDSDQAED